MPCATSAAASRELQFTGVLRMVRPGDEDQGRDAFPARESHRQHLRPVDAVPHFPFPKHGFPRRQLVLVEAEREAAARTAAVEADRQARLLRRSATDDRQDAERPVVAA